MSTHDVVGDAIRLLRYILIVSLAILAVSIIGAFKVKAQEQEVGTGLICDTPKQIESVVALANASRDLAASVEQVNVKEGTDPPACAVAQVAYIRGEKVGQVRTSDGLR